MSKMYKCKNCGMPVRVSHILYCNLSQESIDRFNEESRIDNFADTAKILSNDEERYIEVYCTGCDNPNIPDNVQELAMHLGCDIIIQKDNNHVEENNSNTVIKQDEKTLELLCKFVNLLTCEQEAVTPGMPTKKDWLDCYNEAEKHLNKLGIKP